MEKFMITKQIDHSNGRFQLDIITNEDKFDSLAYGGECKLFDTKDEAFECLKHNVKDARIRILTGTLDQSPYKIRSIPCLSFVYYFDTKNFNEKEIDAIRSEFYQQIFDEGMDKLFTVGQAHPAQKRLHPGFYMSFYAL